MLDLNKLADDGVAILGKLSDVATKAEGVVSTGGPEAIKVLEEFKTVMTEAGPVLATIMPLIRMVAGFFPHANPPAPAGQQ